MLSEENIDIIGMEGNEQPLEAHGDKRKNRGRSCAEKSGGKKNPLYGPHSVYRRQVLTLGASQYISL